MDLQPYDYRDPEALIADIADRVPLRAGDVYLALVARPSTEQRIDEVVLLDLDAEQGDYQHAEDEIRRVMEVLPIPEAHPPTYGVMTVVVRPGLTVFGHTEYGWLRAWRYANHFRPCYTSGLVLVTEHGWTDFMTKWGGHTPAMLAS